MKKTTLLLGSRWTATLSACCALSLVAVLGRTILSPDEWARALPIAWGVAGAWVVVVPLFLLDALLAPPLRPWGPGSLLGPGKDAILRGSGPAGNAFLLSFVAWVLLWVFCVDPGLVTIGGDALDPLRWGLRGALLTLTALCSVSVVSRFSRMRSQARENTTS